MKGWCLAARMCVVGLVLICNVNPAQAGLAGLEDLLYEKGHITKEEWVKLKAEREKEEGIIQQRSATTNWYDKISIRGYAQFRYSYLTDEKNLRIDDSDASVGNNTGFTIRRARLVFSGDITDWLSFYLQPDFSAVVPGTTGDGSTSVVQLRDAYTDIFLPLPFLGKQELRIRAGLSKVPYGFETLQSSQQRAPFDRSDAINSAVPGERDIGLFMYYSPAETRKLFRRLVDSGLKGSGDYGVLGIGVYNGQGINISELNDNKYVVLHATYPLELPYGQIIQFGVDAYRGTFNVGAASGTGLPATPIRENNGNILDERVGVHFVLYPQPFGLQAEWNWGHGPRLNATQTAIQEGDLQGGYVQAMYRWNVRLPWLTALIPYVRWQEYDGGRKNRTNAPSTFVREWEIGLEWQIVKALEFTIAYANTERTNTRTAPYETQEGDLIRTQLQWNY
ncbi:MAG: porin [Nitrospira sp.]|nr:porin [Nitrospira sp.]